LPTIEILGIHPFPEASTPCHLVEALVHGADGDFPIFDFTQERPGLSQVEWQIPHCAKIMSAEGTGVMADAAGTCDDLDLWMDEVRLAFFFHHLDPSLPLQTPFGEVSLPEPSALPERLRVMEYEED
jgi:hypothetical protein